MNIIAKLTKDCPREDCSVQCGGSTVTLLGWTPLYDKQGNRTDSGDPNTTTSGYRCHACGRSWSVMTQYGETRIASVEPPHS